MGFHVTAIQRTKAERTIKKFDLPVKKYGFFADAGRVPTYLAMYLGI